MTQERREQFQPPQVIDSERLQALQHLQRSLNPFQESPEAERLRAIGLSNLYLQMADPSVEFLEAVSGSLASMPFANLRQLQFDTYNAGENPREFFAKHEIAVDDPERLQAGIGNSGELIDKLVHRYDYETGQLNWGEELNPKALAESAHERIQISNGERQIRKAVERVQNEPSLRRRCRMGLNLKKQVLDYIGSFSFTFSRRYDRDEPLEPTWENLTTRYSGLSTQLETKDGSTTVGSFELEDAVDVAQAAILRYPFEKRLEQMPSIDRERFDQLRFQYGAKAANLIILSELVADINKLRRNRFGGVQLAVPDFQAVAVDSYRAWREGKLIDDDLRPYFEWVNGLKERNSRDEDERNVDYMVRSSAVLSEDGENVTGAGVYESVRVYGGGTFQDFKDAVTRVYESTDSPQAQAYRTQHGIDGEEMGLLIQKYVSPSRYSHGQSEEGYINSRLIGIPQLMEIVTRTSRNFVKRKELDFFLALDADRHKDAFQIVHHFPPDQYRIDPDLPIRAAQLTSVVERIWGRDIQVEFVAEGSTINFVQVRELPVSTLSQAPEVQFSDESPIHTGASIGVGDMELPVLDNRDDNSEKVGVVIFMGNYGWSMENNTPRLPKEGAVIIYNDDGKNGHIQTLCAEKGLVCVFPDVNEDDRFTRRYHELSGLRRVRIVSNGIEARVYGIQKEDISEVNGED